MFSKIASLFSRIESDKTPLKYWLLSLAAIIFIRNLLEGLLEASRKIAYPETFFFEYPLSYIFLFANLLIILKLFTKEETKKLFKVLVVLFALLLLVPIADFIISSGEGYTILYIQGDAEHLKSNLMFLTSAVASPGQKIQISIFGSLLILYLFIKTRSPIRTLAGAALSYGALFIMAAITSLIFAASTLFFQAPEPGTEGIDFGYLADYTYPIVNIVYSIFITACLALLLFLSSKRIFALLKASLRPVRIVHYLSLAIFGIFLGLSFSSLEYPLYNFLYGAAFLIYTALMYQFASLANDYFDGDLHMRAKKYQGAIDKGQVGILAIACLILSLMLASSISPEISVISVTILSFSYLYSAPPIRMKRIPILSSMTLASIALLVVFGGFATFAGEDSVELFPWELAFAVFIVYTLGTNYKDLKDRENDEKNKVYTIPVLLGIKRGKAVIAALVALSFLLVPLLLDMPILHIPSSVAAVMSIVFIYRDSNERCFRLMHLGYLLLVAYLIMH